MAANIGIALASLRLQNLISMLRSKALAAALSTVVCLQLGCLPLLARPTRTPARPGVGRMAVSQSAQRNSKTVAKRDSEAPVRSRAAVARAATDGPRAGSTRLRRAGAKNASDVDVASVRTGIRGRSINQASDQPVGRRGRNRVAMREESPRARVVPISIERNVRPLRTRGRGARLADNGQHLSGSRSSANSEPFAIVSETPVNRSYVMRTVPHSSIDEIATSPLLAPALRISSLYDSRGHLVVPPPLYGSHENLLRQNEMANRDGLDRIRDDSDLLDLCRQQKLVPIQQNDSLRIDATLPENRRYSRPWTATFLSVMARDYYATFHQPLQVDSAVRTIAVQQRLTRSNGNAAPSTGDNASPHLTGQAVDIAKRGLSVTQIAWMRAYLQPLIGQGKIDVEEEFHQACFHISVYRNYVSSSPNPFNLATAR